MPLASYDYDYYEYVNGRRVNKTTYGTSIANRRTSAATSQSRRASGTTQTRKHTTSVAKPQMQRNTTTKRATQSVNKKANTNSSAKKVVKRNATAKKITTKKTTVQKKKYDIDIPIKTSSKIVNKPKEMTLKKPKTKKSITLKDAISKTFGVAVFFIIAFAICYRYSLINEEFIALKGVKKEYENIQNVNEQIQADIESKTDLTYIENYAKYQLGMQKPSNSQIKYVSIEKKDKILTPVTIEEDTEANWFETICAEVRKVLD